MAHDPIPDNRIKFDPKTGMYWGEEIKPPPHLCLEVHHRNSLWRRLAGQRPVEFAIKEGDEVRFTESGEVRTVDAVKPNPGGRGVTVSLRPVT